jgi:hypothetical protein
MRHVPSHGWSSTRGPRCNSPRCTGSFHAVPGCSMLYCVAACCTVLQRVVLWCSALYCVAAWCGDIVLRDCGGAARWASAQGRQASGGTAGSECGRARRHGIVCDCSPSTAGVGAAGGKTYGSPDSDMPLAVPPRHVGWHAPECLRLPRWVVVGCVPSVLLSVPETPKRELLDST